MNKKKLILITIIILLFMFILFLIHLLFNKYVLKNNFEEDVLSFSNKNTSQIFKIDKITFFSNADAVNKTLSTTNFTLENLYQYTDIALFISSPLENKNSENTLKKVSISNIQFNHAPSIGTQNLYYKNINNFAKSDIIDENIITNSLDFNITSENEANLDVPTLYNNLANPIVLSYINSNIKQDYTITDTSLPITYNGLLLKRCNVALESLACNLSFDVYITNNLNQDFKCTIYMDIPLNDESKSIYDGNITVTKNTNFIFYRYN